MAPQRDPPRPSTAGKGATPTARGEPGEPESTGAEREPVPRGSHRAARGPAPAPPRPRSARAPANGGTARDRLRPPRPRGKRTEPARPGPAHGPAHRRPRSLTRRRRPSAPARPGSRRPGRVSPAPGGRSAGGGGVGPGGAGGARARRCRLRPRSAPFRSARLGSARLAAPAMAQAALGAAGLHFDELNKLRVLEPEVAAQTAQLREQCRAFVDKTAEFQNIVGSLIELVDQLAKAVESEKMKAIGARNLLKSIAKQREAQEQQLQALIAEKKMQLERYRIEYETLCKIEADQNEFIDQFIFQK
uniref:Uncharacterized protein n=1 Tax=Geospiza parvula TaxID=87175 RepID=A0A8C3NDA3_GEOPR